MASEWCCWPVRLILTVDAVRLKIWGKICARYRQRLSRDVVVVDIDYDDDDVRSYLPLGIGARRPNVAYLLWVWNLSFPVGLERRISECEYEWKAEVRQKLKSIMSRQRWDRAEFIKSKQGLEIASWLDFCILVSSLTGVSDTAVLHNRLFRRAGCVRCLDEWDGKIWCFITEQIRVP